ncbi:MAG: hypothetical protein K2H22_03895 [Muribaculaceae bacterium]|nr:hypothetical protein [Muribaculaceae bacterium]
MDDWTSIVLVEGKSESLVLPELCRIAGVDRNFRIQPENSLNELKKALKTYLKSTNTLRKIWVVVDADVSFDGAWQSIKDILLRSGKYSFDARMSLPEGGAIIEPSDSDDLTVGVWIMPDNKEKGMLEDFMLKLIPESDGLLPRVNEIIDRLDMERESHSGIFKSVHKSKAKMHTWLAWHDTPGESLSVAIQKRLFAIDKDLCSRFTKWLDALN